MAKVEHAQTPDSDVIEEEEGEEDEPQSNALVVVSSSGGYARPKVCLRRHIVCFSPEQ